MSDKELAAYQDALRLVPVRWIAEFTRLLEEGECSDEFMAFFKGSPDCQRAFETVFGADELMAALTTVSGNPVDES